MAQTTSPVFSTKRTRPSQEPQRDRIVYTTKFNAYHCDDDTCIEVQDARTGRPVADHACLGMIAIAALDTSGAADPAVASPSQARPGQYLRFTPPTLDGPDIVTTELEAIEFRLHASTPALPAPDGAGCGIAILTLEPELVDCRVVYADQAMARISGYTLDQLRGHSAWLLAGARPSAAHLRAIESALHAGRPFVAIQRKTRPHGSFYDALMRIEPLRGSRDGSRRVILLQRELAP